MTLSQHQYLQYSRGLNSLLQEVVEITKKAQTSKEVIYILFQTKKYLYSIQNQNFEDEGLNVPNKKDFKDAVIKLHNIETSINLQQEGNISSDMKLHIFYCRHFESFAIYLLTDCSTWIETFTQMEKEQLFYYFFNKSPIDILAQVLLSIIRTVEPYSIVADELDSHLEKQHQIIAQTQAFHGTRSLVKQMMLNKKGEGIQALLVAALYENINRGRIIPYNALQNEIYSNNIQCSSFQNIILLIEQITNYEPYGKKQEVTQQYIDLLIQQIFVLIKTTRSLDFGDQTPILSSSQPFNTQETCIVNVSGARLKSTNVQRNDNRDEQQYDQCNKIDTSQYNFSTNKYNVEKSQHHDYGKLDDYSSLDHATTQLETLDMVYEKMYQNDYRIQILKTCFQDNMDDPNSIMYNILEEQIIQKLVLRGFSAYLSNSLLKLVINQQYTNNIKGEHSKFQSQNIPQLFSKLNLDIYCEILKRVQGESAIQKLLQSIVKFFEDKNINSHLQFELLAPILNCLITQNASLSVYVQQRLLFDINFSTNSNTIIPFICCYLVQYENQAFPKSVKWSTKGIHEFDQGQIESSRELDTLEQVLKSQTEGSQNKETAVNQILSKQVHEVNSEIINTNIGVLNNKETCIQEQVHTQYLARDFIKFPGSWQDDCPLIKLLSYLMLHFWCLDQAQMRLRSLPIKKYNQLSDIIFVSFALICKPSGQQSKIQQNTDDKNADADQVNQYQGKTLSLQGGTFLRQLMQGITNRLDSLEQPIINQAMRIGNMMSYISSNQKIFQDFDERVQISSECIGFDSVAQFIRFTQGVQSQNKDSEEQHYQQQQDLNSLDQDFNQLQGFDDASLGEGLDPQQKLYMDQIQKGLKDNSKDFKQFNDDSSQSVARTDSLDSDTSLQQLNEIYYQGPSKQNDDEVFYDPEGRPYQLSHIIEKLKTRNNAKETLSALKLVKPLIETQPDELDFVAGALARQLLFSDTPDYVEKDPKEGIDYKEMKYQAIISLMVYSPQNGAIELLELIYSEHLVRYSRLLLLDAAQEAALKLSNFLDNNTDKFVNYRNQDAQASQNIRYKESQLQKTGKQRIFAPQKLEMINANPIQNLTQMDTSIHQDNQHYKKIINKFSEIGISWIEKIIKGLIQADLQEDVRIDLYKDDFQVFQSTIQTLGVFAQCSKNTPQAFQYSRILLEFLNQKAVQQHPRVEVKRAALICSGQVLQSIPQSLLQVGDGQMIDDDTLLTQIDELLCWYGQVVNKDSDQNCQVLAQSCLQLYKSIAIEQSQFNQDSQVQLGTLEQLSKYKQIQYKMQ